MRAVICTGYGAPEVLQMVDLPRPVPAADEILVRIRATTVTSGDWRVRSLEMPPGFSVLARLIFGLARPRQPVLGSEAAGEVEETGRSVTNFQCGDRVLLFDGARMGCHAEFKCIKADGNVVRIPESMDFSTAAALPFGGTTAMDFLRKLDLRKGDGILIIGASGSVGCAAVQLAHGTGAVVTAVCSSANVDLVRSLGADEVVDYSKIDVRRLGPAFDVVLETVGALSLRETLPLLREGGRAALIVGGLGDMLAAPWTAKSRGFKIVIGPASERVDDLERMVALTAQGAFRPVVEKTFPFEEIAEAHRLVGGRHKKGNVVVTLSR